MIFEEKPAAHRLDMAIREVCALRAVPDLSDLELVCSVKFAGELAEELPGVVRLSRPRPLSENRRASSCRTGTVLLDGRFRHATLRLVVDEAPDAIDIKLAKRGALEAEVLARHAAVKSLVRDVAQGHAVVRATDLGAIPVEQLSDEDLAELEALTAGSAGVRR